MEKARSYPGQRRKHGGRSNVRYARRPKGWLADMVSRLDIRRAIQKVEPIPAWLRPHVPHNARLLKHPESPAACDYLAELRKTIGKRHYQKLIRVGAIPDQKG